MPAITNALIPTNSHIELISWLLEVGILFANVAVWGGVWLEDDQFTEKTKKFGWKLLLIGLAVETAFGAFLFAADTAERSQDGHRITDLTLAAAPRELSPPKTFILSFIAAERRSGIAVQSYAFDVEGARLATEIINQLRSMGFVVADDSLTATARAPMAFGVYVSGPDKDLVQNLVSWLNDSNLGALAEAPPPSGGVTFGGGQTFTHGEASATIFVGAKPISPIISN